MCASFVKNKIYGLTGGIASGKSSALLFFEKNGFYVIDSDKIVKDLWLDLDVLKKISKTFKLKNDENLKKEVTNLIFVNYVLREKLNEIIHPLVFSEIEKLVDENIKKQQIIIDMPLLFEVGYENKVDEVILIYSSKRNQLKRLMKRNNLSKKDALNRINAQLPLKNKVYKSNYVIRNNSSFANLERQINKLIKKIS